MLTYVYIYIYIDSNGKKSDLLQSISYLILIGYLDEYPFTIIKCMFCSVVLQCSESSGSYKTANDVIIKPDYVTNSKPVFGNVKYYSDIVSA